MFRAFFDIDGVLINGFHTRTERRRRWDSDIEKDLGISFDRFQDIFKGWFLDAIQGRVDFETTMQHWLNEHGFNLPAKEVIDYWHRRDSDINASVLDVVKGLYALKDTQTFTATNQTHERIAYLRDTLGWGLYFTDFYYSARLGCLKYDSAYFAQIEKELAFDPKENPPLYFDDDPRNVEVASNRGWDAVLVDGPEDVTTHPKILDCLK